MSLYYLTKGLGRFQDVLSTLNPIEVAAAAPADNPEANPLGALKVPARDPNALVNAQ
jgi:hypothetical protein